MKADPFAPHGSDPVIIGAGPAGCAAALRLVRDGHAPCLIERSAQPSPRLCGQFLSGEAVALLRSLGVDVAALGGHETRRVRLWSEGRFAEVDLPRLSYGISRRALDGALQDACVAAGVRLLRGTRVCALAADAQASGWTLRLGDGRLQAARTVFLAVGKTDLAGARRLAAMPVDDLLGIQVHLRLQPQQRARLQGCVEVVLLPEGYAGLQCIEAEVVNLCMLIRRPSDGGAPADWLARTVAGCTMLRQRLDGAQTLHGTLQTIFRVPYGFLHQEPPVATSASPAPRSLWRLGDQAAVIPSVTGDGMAMAVHGGLLAARMWQHGHTPAAYHQRLAAQVGPGLRLAGQLLKLAAHPWSRRWLPAVLQAFPSLLQHAGERTRVPPAALRDTMEGR